MAKQLHKDHSKELRAKAREKVVAKRKKLGRKLRPKEFREIVESCLDAEPSKKNGFSLSQNPPHA
jgi:hypothetical protein